MIITIMFVFPGSAFTREEVIEISNQERQSLVLVDTSLGGAVARKGPLLDLYIYFPQFGSNVQNR